MSDTPPRRAAPRRKALEIIVERVPLAGKRVVDVGCGEGGFARALAGLGARVTGVECGVEMLARARAAAPAADETYLEGVGEALPVEDAGADIIVFMNSLHHVPIAHMDKALGEAARALAPGGVVLVNEPVADGDFFQLTRLVDDETLVRAEALAALGRAVASGLFAQQAEILYLNPVRFADYHAFAQRMGLIDATRKAKVAADETLLRQRFDALSSPHPDGGRYFDQPARLYILGK